MRELDVVLKEARFQVENDLVDLDNVEPDTFGEDSKNIKKQEVVI